MIAKFILPAYFLLGLILFVYSYGFLDFNLTLSSHPFLLQIFGKLQHLVYFERPLSGQVFNGIFLVFYLLYLWLLFAVNQERLKSFPWKPFLFLVIFLTFAYPMLSADIFNYIFHTKILWFYHANPHLHAPLEFSGDLWLRFMRWVHTPSAYGPGFTLIESPAYLLSFGKFVPALYLMKLTMTTFFVWAIYLLGQLGRQLKYAPSKIIFIQLLIAFNPYLLLDMVVNSHNDVVMLALFLASLNYFWQHRLKLGWLTLLFSVSVKYITAVAAPALLLRNRQLQLRVAALLLFLPILLSPGRYQSWYLGWVFLPAALTGLPWVYLWISLASLAATFFYLPFVATGFWLNSLPFVSLILYLPLAVSLLFGIVRKSKA
ncbi:MAG: hypothetical protein ACD_27C00032G0017 [uncultured bacterium]|nr:MAG: hypothetical protein ACD_27C00032G0017 [uncultured bacterium]